MTILQQYIEMHKSRCVYLTRYLDDCCAAGVNYESVRYHKDGEPLTSKLSGLRPCVKDDRHIDSCPKAKFLSEREARREAENDLRLGKATIKAMVLIQLNAKEHKQTQGSITCPACGDRLRYSIATNGHIAAQCKTEHCIKFIQ